MMETKKYNDKVMTPEQYKAMKNTKQSKPHGKRKRKLAKSGKKAEKKKEKKT